MTNLTRRVALKFLAIGGTLGSAIFSLPKTNAAQEEPAGKRTNSKTVRWSQMQDRVFLGGDCWANPMEDWQVVDGAAECSSTGPNRNVHLLTHQLTNNAQGFEMSVVIDQIENRKLDTGAGFKIGIRSDINEYRSNSFAGGGIRAGVADGKLVLGRKEKSFDGLGQSKRHDASSDRLTSQRRL